MTIEKRFEKLKELVVQLARETEGIQIGGDGYTTFMWRDRVEAIAKAIEEI